MQRSCLQADAIQPTLMFSENKLKEGAPHSLSAVLGATGRTAAEHRHRHT